jgi:nucleoside-diphosphate-sugar epimerase
LNKAIFNKLGKNMNILIMGATGFVGSYLMDQYSDDACKILGTDYLSTVDKRDWLKHQTSIERCDIRYREQVESVVVKSNPDIIYYLSAQSFPALSWSAPNETLETNIIGTTNLYESLRKNNLNPTVVVACSSAEYGEVAQDNIPVKESHPLRPLHPYGVSKVATEMLSMQYFYNYGMKPVCARIFNTTGPRKTGDVCADFTYRAIQIEKGLIDPVLKVGNLEAYRAITDVRDLTSALKLLANKGTPGDVYNISGEKAYKIGDILKIIEANTDKKFDVYQAPELMRPTDEKIIFGDSSKLKAATGWEQSVSIEATIKDMLNYWRNRI